MGLHIEFTDKNGVIVDSCSMCYSTFNRQIVPTMGVELRDKYVVTDCEGYYTGDYAKIIYIICRDAGRCYGNVSADIIYAMEFM